MADLSNIPFRNYTSDDPYNSRIDAAPLDALKNRIDAVNADLENVKSEMVDARGSENSLSLRLSAGLELDGSVKINEAISIPAANVEDQTSIPVNDSDRVLVTRLQREKLEGITPRANRLHLVMGKSDPVENGIVRIVLDDTLRGTIVPAGDGVFNLLIGSIFSGDRVHQHRKNVVLSYSDGTATFPESEDEIIPGSIEIYRNGQAIHSRNFTEVRDRNSGKILSVLFSSVISSQFNPSEELIWANYETRPLTSGISNSSSFGFNSSLERFEKTLDENDIRIVNLPLDNLSQRPWQFWMIDITAINLKAPYETALLFMTPGERPDVSGHQLYSYGVDWDVVTISGATYLRWRYDRNAGATNGIPDSSLHPERWSFLTESGSGSPEVPVTGFATFDLVANTHLEFLY